MAKQKLVLIVSAVCVLLLIVGFVGLNWNPPIADDTTGTSTNTESPSSSAPDDLASENEVPANTDDNNSGGDYVWSDSDVSEITLNKNSIAVDNKQVATVDGTTVTITSAGTYRVSGTLDDGQLIVDTDDEEAVTLILNGVTISSASNSPLYVAQAEETVIVLADGTENYLTDTAYNQDNATLLSKDDLTIRGDGTLTVKGNVNDAIRSNDGLVIESGTIKVTSIDDGIRGKDFIVVKGGYVTINSVGDGLKSDNEEEADKGYITIEAGTIDVTSTQGDAITAQTDLHITDGTFTLTSGGGADSMLADSISTKGLKSALSITIDGGTFSIHSSDDAIHSNDIIVINGGTFDIASGDDGIHADISVEINNGNLDVTKSYEGVESAVVTINGGYLKIYSSDDGINLVDATESTSTWGPAQGGFGRPGQGGDMMSQNCYLYVNGGFVFIESDGDGVDSNGYIEMANGFLIINGPLSNADAAIDYGGGSFTITGGTLVAVGSAGMAQAPSASSTQYYANLRFGSTQYADTLVNVQTDSGEDVLTFCPTKTYQSLVFSTPELATGSYTVYVGGSSTGTPNNGLYEDGTYSGGTAYGNFTIS
ncbi:MAG: carbohydrate-binding domain-containing protein [archaeon]